MNRVIVLGAGQVGAAIARDLARDPRLAVTAADSSEDALRRLRESPERPSIRTVAADLTDRATLSEHLKGQQLVIGAVPGPMGFATLREVLDQGLPAVDISFFEEDAFELDDLARRRGAIAIVDAGVAPGLSNLILGHHEGRLRETTRFECLVGGVPADPVPPWGYRAPFSPIDVIAEYTRPARFRRAGRTVTLAALDELEHVDLPGAGRFEAFLTDGLRTLLRTSEAPDLVEKTLRWPGHAHRIRALRDSGFFDPAPREIDGCSVSPLALTTALLFDAWRYAPGEADLAVMRVIVEGRDDGGPVRHTYRLVDHYDPVTDVSAMARVTGYTATAHVRLLLDDRWREPGVAPPERIARAEGALESVLAHLRARGVLIEHIVDRPRSAP